MTPPTLRRASDRIYEHGNGNIGGLREYLESRGFRHYDNKASDLYKHRWTSPDRTTVLTPFESGRLVILGPPVAALDALVVESEVSA